MLNFLQRLADFLQFFVPFAGLVFLLLRIYVLSNSNVLIKEIRTLRQEVAKIQRAVKKIQDERRK